MRPTLPRGQKGSSFLTRSMNSARLISPSASASASPKLRASCACAGRGSDRVHQRTMAPQQHHPGRALVRRGALYCCATRCGCERVRACARACGAFVFCVAGVADRLDRPGGSKRSARRGTATACAPRSCHGLRPWCGSARRSRPSPDATDNIAVDCLTPFGRRIASADFGASARRWSCSAARRAYVVPEYVVWRSPDRWSSGLAGRKCAGPSPLPSASAPSG
jgi:hypothetical protein